MESIADRMRKVSDTLEVQRVRGLYKRPLDLAILLTSQVALLPLWPLLWVLIPLAIWLDDRGPIFFRQPRAGKDGRVFTMLKFRTMVRNAEELGPAWTIRADPRITRVGRLLRRTALDELPGLVAILRGDMSFVGPRSLALHEQRLLEAEVPGFAERLRVRPGLTGLAQVYDPMDDARTKLRYDLEYIRRMGVWLDLKLLFLSVSNSLTGRWDRRSGKASDGPE